MNRQCDVAAVVVSRLPKCDLLTPSEVGSALAISSESVRQMVKQGRLDYVDVGVRPDSPRYKILRESVVELIERGAGRCAR